MHCALYQHQKQFLKLEKNFYLEILVTKVTRRNHVITHRDIFICMIKFKILRFS